jgi:hypothetical protein
VAEEGDGRNFVIWGGEVGTVHKTRLLWTWGNWNGRGLENILKRKMDWLLSLQGMLAVSCEFSVIGRVETGMKWTYISSAL